MVDWKPNTSKKCENCKKWEDWKEPHYFSEEMYGDGNYCHVCYGGNDFKGEYDGSLENASHILFNIFESLTEDCYGYGSDEWTTTVIANICPLYTPKQETSYTNCVNKDGEVCGLSRRRKICCNPSREGDCLDYTEKTMEE